jgi:uncharacterized membrane protein YfhO
MLEERQSNIDKQYSDAEEAKAKALEDKLAYEEKLSAASIEADGIVQSAVDTAKAREKEILSDAKRKAEGIVAKAEGDALIVFSEIFTKQGWRVKIDGKEARALRADYILRAVEMPAGEHTIEWSYRAPNWALVEGIAMACSVVVLAAFLLTLIYVIRNARRQENKA